MIAPWLKAMLSTAAVVGLGVIAGTPPHSQIALRSKLPPPSSRQEFVWPARPLEGTRTAPRTAAIEIRGFDLGQCAMPAGAAETIAQAAAEAARVSNADQDGSVTIVGGADGTPIRSLRRTCATSAALSGTLNEHLAAARAVSLQRLFLAEYGKAGGTRPLNWVHLPPVVTANLNQPHDRSASLRIVWSPLRLAGSR
jgi:hypothetical protein